VSASLFIYVINITPSF